MFITRRVFTLPVSSIHRGIQNRMYVSVPDMLFGEDEVVGVDTAGKKVAKNPYVARNINGKFVGPWSRESNKKLSDVIRLALSKNNPRFKNPKKYEKRDLLKPLTVDKEKLFSTEKPHITWMGHASCYYQVDGVYFLTDPVWGQRASPFSFIGPKRFYDSCIPIEDLKLDVILLSHTHYDHLDMPTARRIGNRALWVVPLGVKALLAKEGITNVTELDWWSTYHYLSSSGKTFEITFLPAKHWTARGLFDRNTCLWGSFAVKSTKHKFFFSGDTAYCSVFKAIGDTFGPFDFSAIAIGAYSPRWFMKDVHCNPEEAVKIHLDLRSKQSMGIHWGTFRLTEEDPVEPALELARARDLNKLTADQFFTTAQGETLLLGEKTKYDIAETHSDLYGHYLEELRNAPLLE